MSDDAKLYAHEISEMSIDELIEYSYRFSKLSHKFATMAVNKLHEISKQNE